jgi:hypothetical protein
MGLVSWIFSALGTIALAVVVQLITDEISGRTPRLAKWMIELAARRLPEPLRSRYQSEWLQDLEDIGGTLSRLKFGIGCLISVRSLIRDTGAYRLEPNRVGWIAEAHELPDGTRGIAHFPLPNFELSDFTKGVVTYDARQFGGISVEALEEHRSELEELWGCPVIIEVPMIEGVLLEGTVRIRPKWPHLYKPESPPPELGFWSKLGFWWDVVITLTWGLVRPFRARRSEADLLGDGRPLYVDPESRFGKELSRAALRWQKIATLPSLGKQSDPPRLRPQLVIEYNNELLCVWNGDEAELQSLDDRMLMTAERMGISVDNLAIHAIVRLPEFRELVNKPKFEQMAMHAAVWWILQQDTHDADYPGRVRDHITKTDFDGCLVIDKRGIGAGVKARRRPSS